MVYAVVKISGKQYKVSEGETLDIDKIDSEKGKKLTFNEVLLLNNGKNIKVGQPYVAGTKVSAEILEQFKGKKLRVAKFKAKSRYRRVMGFRPELTKIKIIKIS